MKYTVKVYDNETLNTSNPVIIKMREFKDKKEAIKYASFCEKDKVLDYVYYTVTTNDQIIFDTQYD